MLLLLRWWSTVGKQLKRRSEVDRRLEQLVQKQSFKLREPGQQSVIKVGVTAGDCDCLWRGSTLE
jgi:hypothetical protein